MTTVKNKPKFNITEPGKLLHIMAAHSPLSARLAEEAGFDGLWASGFELSALYGLADVSLVTMTQHLDMVRAIAEQTTLPIVADIDTGFGNAVNVIYAIQQYEGAGASAVVIEDQIFPKMTSLSGDAQQLLRIEEFQGKVAAAVDARSSEDFLIIARTEALNAGLGEEEALKRAAAYEAAGADMILIHSKQKTPAEIESFTRNWTGSVPLVIVPTAYPELNEERILKLEKIKIVIYGNHALRAAVTGMKDVFSRILKDRGSEFVSKDIVSVQEIFRLQNMEQVKKHSDRFLR